MYEASQGIVAPSSANNLYWFRATSLGSGGTYSTADAEADFFHFTDGSGLGGAWAVGPMDDSDTLADVVIGAPRVSVVRYLFIQFLIDTSESMRHFIQNLLRCAAAEVSMHVILGTLFATLLLSSSAHAGDALETRWIRDSIEYHTLAEQTYRMALQSVESEAKNHKRWGVVLDLDETVLDNSTYQLERHAYGNKFEMNSGTHGVSDVLQQLSPAGKTFWMLCGKWAEKWFSFPIVMSSQSRRQKTT